MSVRDQVTKMNLATLFSGDIAADGVSTGTEVDGADDELGLSFFLSIRGAYTDGNYTLTLEDSEDDVTYAPVPANQIIHGGSDDPAQGGVTTGDGVTLSAALALAEDAVKIGVFSNKRYVRPVITADTVTTGAVGVNVDVVKNSEYLAA